MLHGRTQDACAVSFSITHVNQMHTELCTCAFSACADLLYHPASFPPFSKMVESRQEINFKQDILKIPEWEALKVHQL